MAAVPAQADYAPWRILLEVTTVVPQVCRPRSLRQAKNCWKLDVKLMGAAVQGNAVQSCGEFQLQPPEKGAEVASVDISENRLALLWSNGVLQCFSHQAALSGQVNSKHLPPCCNVAGKNFRLKSDM